MREWFLAALLLTTASGCAAAREISKSPLETKGPWVVEDGTLKCLGKDRTLRIRKAGLLTRGESSERPPAGHKSTRFLVSPDGKQAIVFDYAARGTAVTVYTPMCEPSKRSRYENLELHHDDIWPDQNPVALKGGRGFLAILTAPAVDCWGDEQGCPHEGYVVQWDALGKEQLRAGPYEFGNILFHLFHEDKYGYLHNKVNDSGPPGRSGKLFFDLLKGQTYFYLWPHDVGGGGEPEITHQGKVIIKKRGGWIMSDGTKLSNEEFDRLRDGASAQQRLEWIKTVKPNLIVAHEHQFP